MLILLGPFVDEEHRDVAEGNLDASFDQVFGSLVARCHDIMQTDGKSIHTLCPNNSTVLNMQLVLVPSLRDVQHDRVFPQPPLQLPSELVDDRIVCLANPATFKIKEFVVGVVSEDILAHLAGQGKRESTARGR